MSSHVDFITPVGRLVWGSLYEPRTHDADGNLLTYKSGPKLGQPRPEFVFRIAIPKQGEQHWSQTEWGAKIYGVGFKAFQAQCQHPTFSWKILDGDSQIPDVKSQRRPCDNDGFAGCWVLTFKTSASAPKLFSSDGSQEFKEPGEILPGYYIQVYGNCVPNNSKHQIGVYLNPIYVARAAFGEVISYGPPASSVGFGGAPLPPGASQTPVASNFNPVMPSQAPGFIPQQPAAPVMPAFVPPVQPQAPIMPVPPAPVVPVQPYPNILNVPNPNVPPVAPARIMTAKANGFTYEQLCQNGFTDELLIQQGYMLG